MKKGFAALVISIIILSLSVFGDISIGQNQSNGLSQTGLGVLAGADSHLSEWNYCDSSAYSYFEIGFFNGSFYLQEVFNNRLNKSTDGITWTFAGNTNKTPSFDGIKYINGEYITPWGKFSFITSPDLVTWKEIQMYRSAEDSSFTNFDLHGGYIREIAFGKGRYTAVGSVDNVGGALVMVSEDSYIWRVIDLKQTVDSGLEKVMFIKDAFYALGKGLYRSTDGEAWTKLTDLPIRELVYTKGAFWGLSEDSLMKSADGISWVKVNVGHNISMSDYSTHITYGGGLLMLHLDDAFSEAVTILTSTNGEEWIRGTVQAPKGNKLNVPIYGNGRYLNNTSYNIFSLTERNSRIYYAAVLNLKGEEANNQTGEIKDITGEINLAGLKLMEDSLSFIFSPEIISRLQSYPYYGGEPNSDFKHMRLSTEASSIVRNFYDYIADFKDNETFFSRRELTYKTGEFWYGIRGVLQTKLPDGTIVEQDMEYVFKDGNLNDKMPGGAELELAAKRALGEKRIRK